MKTTSLRIAHIDDDADLRSLVRLVLSLEGACSIVSCESGEVAQQLVPGFFPDVLLVDMSMPPGMDGVATVEALRERMDLSDVSIIFASATEDPDHLRRFKQAGAAGFIQKPFDALELAAQISRLHES